MTALGVQSAFGFALEGPIANGGDAWQTAVIGYGYAYSDFGLPGGPLFLGDIAAPKNFDQEYRRNVPVLYYGYDDSFSGFFGADAEDAMDGAFGIINSLTNVDNYSAALTEFPLESQEFNPTAQALYLTDMKSVTLHLLVEQLGLADPERFTWTLHDRVAGPKCPVTTIYTVVRRNFDFVPSDKTKTQYSSYVNNVLFTYGIIEECSGPNPLAVTVPFNTDPDSFQFSAVAANNFDVAFGQLTAGGSEVLTPGGGLQIGGYYTGLTRDDIGGLRYLMTTNNINYENPDANSQMVVTNYGGTIPLTTSDFGALLSAIITATNSVTGSTNILLLSSLSDIASNIFAVSITNGWTNVCTPNLVTYFTNYIGEPAGSQTESVTVTNGFTCGPQETFSVVFANVYTNANFTNSPSTIIIDTHSVTNVTYSIKNGKLVKTVTVKTNVPVATLDFSTNTTVTQVTTSLSEQTDQYGYPVGSGPQTNTTTKTITYKGRLSGEYIVLPPGQCGWEILSVLSTNVVLTTNLLTSATNNTGFTASTMIISRFTNHTFIARPITCDVGTNATASYQGIGRVRFQRLPDGSLDPLTGNLVTPITNSYTMTSLNRQTGQLETRTFRRVIAGPDILITASDQGEPNTFVGTVFRDINFDTSTVLTGSAGPGVIGGAVTFDYNKIGDSYWNGPFGATNSFILPSSVNELTQIPSVRWASFDGSTNDPEVYPNGTSIQNLENRLVISISPASPLPSTNVGDYYSATFSATGGVSPYTWGLASGSNPLPSGLTLSTDGVLSGVTSGPAGQYDFTLELVDSQGRVVDLPYSITLE
ncbi:MAG TPA: Ig domain-containing protein [Verrucomicrobiae bacterium]|nr:Ig domain-containing protein [Verrucomicrobiae bacterium]